MPKLGSINHVSMCSNDYELSKKFYGFVLGDLMDYKQIFTGPYCTMWRGGNGECIGVSPSNNTVHHKTNPGLHHLAFNSETREQIDEFHGKIVVFQAEHGGSKTKKVMGEILDKPAEYPQYGPGYYA
ncbi:hypothetical protein BGZ83_009140 [Gryganskiella cystojenkinii]|nr:hypothetical protein BGZ83_009140 [Gryganskiella cystojenkinii]